MGKVGGEAARWVGGLRRGGDGGVGIRRDAA